MNRVNEEKRKSLANLLIDYSLFIAIEEHSLNDKHVDDMLNVLVKTYYYLGIREFKKRLSNPFMLSSEINNLLTNNNYFKDDDDE